jgi:hypothetical protein
MLAVRVAIVAVLVPAAIDYPSLGYEYAERRHNPSRPVAHTYVGLDQQHDAVSTRLTASGVFPGVLVTIVVTSAGDGNAQVPVWIAADL